jgi:nucleoside-diphosphate-sugar epimerase
MGPLTPDCEVPLVHVKDVASAVLQALAAGPELNGQAFNLVEPSAPPAPTLLTALHQRDPHIRLVRLPWWLHRLLAHITAPLLGPKTPGLLRQHWLAARFTRVHYDSQRALQVLGWQPQHRALALAQAPQNPHTP